MKKQPGLLLSFALLVLLAASLSACGGSSNSSSNSTSASAGSVNKSEFEGKITGTVKVWDYQMESVPALKKVGEELDKEFEQLHPGVTVERTAPGGGIEEYEPVLQSAFTSHQGPDVLMMQPGALGVNHWAKGLVPLNELIPQSEQEKIIGWEMDTPGYEKEGPRYAMPVTLNGSIFYYNKKMFKQAGLPTDFHPKTWAEVISAGEKLKAAGLPVFYGGMKGGVETCFWMSSGWQTTNTPKQAIELSDGSMPFTDKVVEDAFEPLLDITNAGLYSEEHFSAEFLEEWAAFGEEKSAMVFSKPAVAGYWGEYVDSVGEKNFGVFVPPGSKYQWYETFQNWTIPTFAKNKPAALALIEFLGSKRGVEAVVDGIGGISSRTDVSPPSDLPVQGQEIAEIYEEEELSPYVCGQLQGPTAFQSLFPEIVQVLEGHKKLPDALQSTQEFSEKTGY